MITYPIATAPSRPTGALQTDAAALPSMHVLTTTPSLPTGAPASDHLSVHQPPQHACAHYDALTPHRCASLGSPLSAPAPPAAAVAVGGRARPGSPHRDSSSLHREGVAHSTGHGATAAAQQQLQYAGTSSRKARAFSAGAVPVALTALRNYMARPAVLQVIDCTLIVHDDL